MEPPSNRDMPDLINFLRQNGYELEQVQYNPQFGGSARAKFSKMAHIDEINGNDVNDATIDITVDFDTRFDYRNAVDDDDEGVIYNDFTQARGLQFINLLWNRTYDNSAPPPVVRAAPVVRAVSQRGAPTNGGKRKGRKTKRRTRKNRTK
jgi:hypothetical protein